MTHEPIANRQPPADFVRIDRPTSLSTSKIWGIGNSFYQTSGPDAWGEGKVPYSITHHHALVDYYTDVLVRLIASEKRAGRLPVSVMELGAGTGHFAWKLLSALDRRLTDGLSAGLLRYEMTDLAAENLRFAHSHPRLRPFFERGILRERVLKLGEELDSDPARAGEGLGKLVVIANYVIDSTPQDIFYIENGEIRACIPDIYSPQDADLSASEPTDQTDSLHLYYELRPVGERYYDDPELDGILRALARREGEGFLIFPVVFLTFLSRMRAAGKQLVLLTSDLPGAEWGSADARLLPTLYWKGGLWMAVHFEAVQAWFERNDGGLLLHSVYYGNLAIGAGVANDPDSSLRRALGLCGGPMDRLAGDRAGADRAEAAAATAAVDHNRTEAVVADRGCASVAVVGEDAAADDGRAAVEAGCGGIDDQGRLDFGRAVESEAMPAPPDSFLALYRKLAELSEQLTTSEILAWLRLVARDPELMFHGLMQLRKRAAALQRDEVRELARIARMTLPRYYAAPNKWDAAAGFAEILLHAGQFDEAITCWEYSMEQSGFTPAAGFGCALSLAQLGKYERSRAMLDRVLSAKPDDEPSMRLLEWLDGQTQPSGESPRPL